MFRSMTSNVSALSSIVANGHRTLHLVSPTPSKIPYSGFSPVRLQTRLTPRPPSPAPTRWLIGRHCSYLRLRRWIRNRSCDHAAPQTSDLNRESSGPWLPSWLCCPAGSWLTMATSAPLSATLGLMHYSFGLRDQLASRRGSPIYSANPFTPCRRLYSGDSCKCSRRYLPRRLWPSPRPQWLGNHIIPRLPDRVGRLTKLLRRSLYATAQWCCLPCSGQDFYYRACVDGVAPFTHVGYD
jgi:hypothetical protein